MITLLKQLPHKSISITLGLFAVTTLSAQVITDPGIDFQPSGGLGVSFETVAGIPDAPGQGAPRLNLLKEAPDGSGRLFVIDQYGFLYHFQPGGSATRYMRFADFLPSFQYVSGQMGSTSFAFHPEFATNGKFYTVISVSRLSGTADFLAKRPINPSDGNGDQEVKFHDVIIEWTATDPSAATFSGTQRELMRIEQPYNDHNVGEIAFNPVAQSGDADYGLLYIAVADGGNVFPIADADPEDNGQDLTTVLGTVLRIDPMGNNSANGAYGIPVDNPFASTDGPELREIYTYGHRNNHRLSWDRRGDNALYNFEMGQSMIEEINRLEKGGNYGWSVREGTFWLKDETRENELFALPNDEVEGTFQYPVFQYDHPPGTNASSGAIAGGFVYRGSEIPSLYGKMIFADFTSDNGGAYYGNISDIDSLAYGEAAPVYHLDVYNSQGQLGDFSFVLTNGASARTDTRLGEDLAGNIYFLNKRNGIIKKMVASPNEPDFAVSADPANIGLEGGTIELSVDAEDPTFGWELEIDEPFITTNGPLEFTGSQQITLTVDALTGATSRTGTIVVAGRRIQINQFESADWQTIFPEAIAIGTDYIETETLGIIEISEWPWVYCFDLNGWVYIPSVLDPSGLIPVHFAR